MGKSKDRETILGGFVWKFAERTFSQGVAFVLSVVLARLLMPEDYGIVAMVNVFILFANVFVSSGFATSLIQKKDADDIDFSSIFYCTLTMSVLMYGIVYVGAPFIADFYNMPDLCLLTRVYALSLIVSSYQTIQQSYVSRHMLFRKNFISTLFGTFLSGVIGIILAFKGYGVWALVWQHLCSVLINTLVLMMIVPWKPKFMFSWERSKPLIRYGSSILASNLIGTIYKEVRQLLIGKFYTPTDLALYNRGSQLPQLVTSNLDTTIRSVLFPAMSNYSEDTERVKQLLRRSLKTTAYVTFFFLTLMAVASKPLIEVLLTDKWIDCVPYMQILCFSNMVVTLSGANLQALKAIGKSDEVLKLEVFKKPIFLIVVFISVKISVLAVVLTLPINALYAFYMNMGPTKKYFNYSRREQLVDLMPSFVLVIIMTAVTLPFTLLPWNDFVIMVIQVLVGLITYIGLSVLFKVESYEYCKNTLSDILQKTISRKRTIKTTTDSR